jgi:hypothetical protein
MESERCGNVTLLVTVHESGLSALVTWIVCFCCSAEVTFLCFTLAAARVRSPHTHTCLLRRNSIVAAFRMQ